MAGRSIFLGTLLAALSAPAFAVTPGNGGDEDDAPSAARTLVQDAPRDDGDAISWRMDAEAFAPEELERDDLRWRVRVRPNRAMGRMSLTF